MKGLLASVLASTLLLVGCQTTTENSSGVTRQASAASAEQMQTAASAVRLCQQFMPDVDATRAAFTRNGYSVAERGAGGVLYTLGSWDVTTQVDSDSADDRLCTVHVRNMTSSQAEILAQPWLRHLDASPVANAQSRSRIGVITGVWRGQASGVPGVVVAYENMRAPRINGAAIKLNYRVQ